MAYGHCGKRRGSPFEDGEKGEGVVYTTQESEVMRRGEGSCSRGRKFRKRQGKMEVCCEERDVRGLILAVRRMLHSNQRGKKKKKTDLLGSRRRLRE